VGRVAAQVVAPAAATITTATETMTNRLFFNSLGSTAEACPAILKLI
jgi:hypothetical protein